MRRRSLLHPREAIRFCDDVRRQQGNDDVPDDVIPRTMMNQRNNAAS